MKIIAAIFFAACLTISAAENLGVITPRRSIFLAACTNRADFAFFVVTVKAHGYQTNDIVFTNFNGVIECEKELRAVTQGRAAMEVFSVCADGEKSETTTNTFDLRRSRPAAPRARTLPVGPSPPMPANFGALAEMVALKPLPGATNAVYPRHRSQ